LEQLQRFADNDFKGFREAIEPFGYAWEPFTVTTRDGYSLTLFRITKKLEGNFPNFPPKPEKVYEMPAEVNQAIEPESEPIELVDLPSEPVPTTDE